MSSTMSPPLSLLSLSNLAADLPRQSPIITPSKPPAQPIQTTAKPTGPTQGMAVGSLPKARRLSSTGQTRRRLSDATAATVAMTMARGSMSTTGLAAATSALSLTSSSNQTAGTRTLSQSVPHDSSIVAPLSSANLVEEGGKKKGTIFRCESCSKIYRHPSCLVKHRWEHSPHWREASKFLLSKHQQVQLLEAAAILSHIAPPGTSLPEDRSLWPSYLSGGVLPGASPPNASTNPHSHRRNSSTSKVGFDRKSRGSSAEEDRDRDSGYGSSEISLHGRAAPPSTTSIKTRSATAAAMSSSSVPYTSYLSSAPRPIVSDATAWGKWRGAASVSSVSSSFGPSSRNDWNRNKTGLPRSSVRGGGDDEEEEEDEHDFDLDMREGKEDEETVDGDAEDLDLEGSDEWAESGMAMDMDL